MIRAIAINLMMHAHKFYAVIISALYACTVVQKIFTEVIIIGFVAIDKLTFGHSPGANIIIPE